MDAGMVEVAAIVVGAEIVVDSAVVVGANPVVVVSAAITVTVTNTVTVRTGPSAVSGGGCGAETGICTTITRGAAVVVSATLVGVKVVAVVFGSGMVDGAVDVTASTTTVDGVDFDRPRVEIRAAVIVAPPIITAPIIGISLCHRPDVSPTCESSNFGGSASFAAGSSNFGGC